MEPTFTPTTKKWYDSKVLVAILCVIFFPVGLYALWMNRTISKGWKVGGTIVIVLFVLAAIGGNEPNSTKTAHAETSTSPPSSAPEVEGQPASTEIGVGLTLKTTYFDVTVNKVELMDRVKTGNQFANLNSEAGHQFLVLNTTFKNVDTESRLIVDGAVFITYNGKEYEFDKSETVMLEGWGLLLDQINPLTSKTTNLVYKIPTEVKGPAYYHPGRSGGNDKIFLGNIE